MSLQLYQVDNKSYLLDFKSLSPHIDDASKGLGAGNGSLNSSMNESITKAMFHDPETALRPRHSGNHYIIALNSIIISTLASKLMLCNNDLGVAFFVCNLTFITNGRILCCLLLPTFYQLMTCCRSWSLQCAKPISTLITLLGVDLSINMCIYIPYLLWCHHTMITLGLPCCALLLAAPFYNRLVYLECCLFMCGLESWNWQNWRWVKLRKSVSSCLRCKQSECSCCTLTCYMRCNVTCDLDMTLT